MIRFESCASLDRGPPGGRSPPRAPTTLISWSTPDCEWAIAVEVRLDAGASQGSVGGFEVSYTDGERSYRTETGFMVGLCDPAGADGGACDWSVWPPED